MQNPSKLSSVAKLKTHGKDTFLGSATFLNKWWKPNIAQVLTKNILCSLGKLLSFAVKSSQKRFPSNLLLIFQLLPHIWPP